MNVLFCLFVMAYKDMKKSAFSSLVPYGIVIPELSKVSEKMNLGLKAGAANLITVFFGLFAVKNVNIPLFTAFRRCGMLSSVIVMFIMESTIPNRFIQIATVVVTAGAITAGWETMETDAYGLAIVWANNFSQAIQNVYISALNKEKKLSAFDINFFFASLGLLFSIGNNFFMTDDYR